MKTYRLVFRRTDQARFDEVRDGTKTIETRAATPKYRAIQAGDKLLFVCGSDSFLKQVAAVKHFDSLDAMFDELPLKQILPWAGTREEARNYIYSFHGYKNKLSEYGVMAFRLGQ